MWRCRRKCKDDRDGPVAHGPTLSAHAWRVTFAGPASLGSVADRNAGAQTEQKRRESDESDEEGAQSVLRRRLN